MSTLFLCMEWEADWASESSKSCLKHSAYVCEDGSIQHSSQGFQITPEEIKKLFAVLDDEDTSTTLRIAKQEHYLLRKTNDYM